mgnify:CR=1 FL=1
MRTAALVFGALLAMAMGSAGACEPPALSGLSRLIDGERHVIGFRTDPETVRVGEFFAVEYSVCRRDGNPAGETAIDAMMPEHRHGMNFRPASVPAGPGRYRAEGLMFHMPGLWRYMFEIRGDGGERLHGDLRLR